MKIFFWFEKFLPNIHKIIKEGGLKQKTDTGDIVVLCEKSVAKELKDCLWFIILDTMKYVTVSYFLIIYEFFTNL